MRVRTHRALLLFCLAVFAPALGRAAAEVEVSSVHFTNVRPANGAPASWLEADIVLNAFPPPAAPGHLTGRVHVTLTLGFELPASGGVERHIEYYRAEAECVALDAGRADVRFYLPPELVKRDQLHGDPKFWGVELEVDGRALPPASAAYATSLVGGEARKNFQGRAGPMVAMNHGLLQPQYLTPFVLEYPRTTPTFVRRDGINSR